MSLDSSLRSAAVTEGANFFGVADITPARDAIREQGGDLVASFPRAVSIGLGLFHPIVDQLPVRLEKPEHAKAYGNHCYAVVNQRLDHIVSRLAGLLQSEKYQAYPVASSQTVNGDRLMGIFSNKMAAHMAGLGWIGKSCLLVTPEAGPRVRWATVLTDAPLTPTGEPTAVRCGTCTECVDACPAGAFTGKNFREDEHRDVRFDVHKCQAYRKKTSEDHGVGECGMCLYACPHGKKASAGLL